MGKGKDRMMSKLVSLEVWRDLYSAASRFKEVACWDWLLDSDLFAVQNPATGEMGYCCVMGALGEHFALGVYLGPKGLESYMKMREADPADPLEIMMGQKCLMASFEERGALQKLDLEVIRSLGHKFRGRNSWPLFRSYLPRYAPWHLTEDEARYLTLALEESIEVAGRVKEEPALLISRGQTRLLARVPERSGGASQWRDDWIVPMIPAGPPPVPPLDETGLKRLKNSLPQKSMTWEIDLFYLPTVIMEGDRPFYPSTLLCVDRDSGFIFGTEVMGPEERELAPARIQRHFASAGALPNQVAVSRDEVFQWMGPMASALGIKVRRAKRLRSLERARSALVGHLTGA